MVDPTYYLGKNSVEDPDNYGKDPRRAPAVPDGMRIIYDLPGRIIMSPGDGSGVDHRSHYFRVVHGEWGYQLIVEHGGGFQRTPITSYDLGKLIPAFEACGDTDARYLLAHGLHESISAAIRNSIKSTANRYE